MLNWIREKFSVINSDKARKGYSRVFKELITEYLYKRKYWKLGIDNPANNAALANTNAKSANEDSHENQPTAFYSAIKTFKKLPLPAKDIQLIDIGCGSGRLLCYGMISGFASVTGVDLDEAGVKKALENCKLLFQQGFQTRYEVKVVDATTCIIPPQVNVVYLFNPFGEKTTEVVLSNIVDHVNQHKVPLYIAYVNPVHVNLFGKWKNATLVYEDYYRNGERDSVIYRINPA